MDPVDVVVPDEVHRHVQNIAARRRHPWIEPPLPFRDANPLGMFQDHMRRGRLGRKRSSAPCIERIEPGMDFHSPGVRFFDEESQRVPPGVLPQYPGQLLRPGLELRTVHRIRPAPDLEVNGVIVRRREPVDDSDKALFLLWRVVRFRPVESVHRGDPDSPDFAQRDRASPGRYDECERDDCGAYAHSIQYVAGLRNGFGV